MTRTLLMTLLGWAALAWGEEPPPTTTQTPPPLVAPAPVEEQAGSADDRLVTLGEAGEIYLGSREVTPVELYSSLGREDLVEKAHSNVTRRIVLFTSAGVVMVAAAVTAGILFATAPSFTTGDCNHVLKVYNNQCVPTNVAHQAGAGVSLAGGFIVASLLFTFGRWARPDVMTPYELERFVREHNASLAKRSTKVKLLPWISSEGGGIVAAAQF